MELHAEGMRMRLPRSWEGRIRRNPSRTRSAVEAPGPGGDVQAQGATDQASGEDQRPVAQVGNFVLPAALDDFGAQAVALMDTGHCFVALLEYGEQEAGSALFAGSLPRRLTPDDFSSRQLQRQLPDQLGAQFFGTEGGRAFCLYVVVAGRARLATTLESVNQVLSTLQLEPR